MTDDERPVTRAVFSDGSVDPVTVVEKLLDVPEAPTIISGAHPRGGLERISGHVKGAVMNLLPFAPNGK